MYGVQCLIILFLKGFNEEKIMSIKLCQNIFPVWKSLREGREGTVNIYRDIAKHEFIVITKHGAGVDDVKIYYKLFDIVEIYGCDGWHSEAKEGIKR